MINTQLEIQNNNTEISAVVTTVEKNRVVAHVHDSIVDEAVIVARNARQATTSWDTLKPDLRSKGLKVLDTIIQTHTAVKAVLLHGSKKAYIEICPSNKPKEVLKELVDEAKFRGINVVEEQVEVTLKGPLAIWAVNNLAKLTKPEILEEFSSVKKKHVLVSNFMDLYTKAMKEIKDLDVLKLYSKLKEAGYNLPAVELKNDV